MKDIQRKVRAIVEEIREAVDLLGQPGSGL